MNTKYKFLQRKLRKSMPTPEVRVWQKIRGEQLRVKFRRQYAINNRILDFYAPSVKLGIEIDGESHFKSEALRNEELLKDQSLELETGIKIIRFLNREVMRNIDGVCEEILSQIANVKNVINPPPGLPLKKGEEI